MTLLGKIFTGLISALSVVFFVLALVVNATHIDHRKQLTALQGTAKRLETTIDELKKQVDQKTTELFQEQAARRSALSSLQSQLDNERGRLADATSELSRLNAVNTQQNQNLSTTIAEVRRLTDENENIKKQMDIIITDRNQQRKKVISLTDSLNTLRSLEDDLKAQVKKLQDDSTLYQARWETAQSALKTVGITDPEDVPPADLKGEILKVNSDQLVEISVGRDDGLREGHTLDVYRGGQYLGRIRIRRVADDKAVGQILSSFRKGYIQEGDKVAARIN